MWRSLIAFLVLGSLTAVAACSSTDDHIRSDWETLCTDYPAVDGGPPPELTSEAIRHVWLVHCGRDAGAK